MSLIGKKLLLNECLESCSAEQLASLQSLTDSLGTPTLLRLSTLTTSDKGVKYVTCWLDNYTVVHGLFIYTDTKCGLFAFQDEFNNMEAIKIDPVNKNFEYVHEHLSATEFRSTLDDVANTGSGGGSGDLSGLVSVENGKIVIKDATTNCLKLVIDPTNGSILTLNQVPTNIERTWSIGNNPNYGDAFNRMQAETIAARYLQDEHGNEVNVSSLISSGNSLYKHDVTAVDTEGRTLNFSYYSTYPYPLDEDEGSYWDVDGYTLKNCSGTLIDLNNNPRIAVISGFDDYEGGGYVLYLMYDGVDFNQDNGEFSVQSMVEEVYEM